MSTHPLFNPTIKWMSPHEVSDAMIKKLSDEKMKYNQADPSRAEEIKNMDEEYDRKIHNRRSVAKWARRK